MSRHPLFVEIAKVTAPHGLAGFITLFTYSDNKAHFQPGSVLYSAASSEAPFFEVAEYKGTATRPQVRFKGRRTRDEAEALVGTSLFIPTKALPALESNSFYFFELEGLEVVDESGKSYGTVDTVRDYPANVILAVRGKSEFLLPFVPEVVLEVDRAQRRIVVQTPFLQQV